MFSQVAKVSRNQWLIFAAGMSAAVAWVFSRIVNINPAILGDEWVYLVTSRHVAFWDQEPPFNLGNYLFNFVYSSTLFFENYYLAAKVINTIFFIGFIVVLFMLALKFLNFWWSAGFAIVAYISPISMYTSMYLPEAIYFFFLAWTLYFLVNALETDSRYAWVLAGSALGLAALSKPHALISAMAIGIFVVIFSLARAKPIKNLLIRAAYLGGSFLVVRLVIGFLLAGPQALGLFSSYGAASGLGTFVSGVPSAGGVEGSLVGAGNVAGAIGLFPTQIVTHTYSLVAYLGAALAVVIAFVIASAVKNSRSLQTNFVLLVLIWLGVMVVAIVLFTGWITGAGDDHTLRVLLRYYDFMFPIVFLAGLVAAFSISSTSLPAWTRWLGSGAVFLLLTPAFSGYFGGLVIQIADAPNLAGLVVDRFTFEWTGGIIAISLLVLAFFPSFAKYAVSASLAFTLALTGYQAQDQYIGFRGLDNYIDKGSKEIKSLLSEGELEDLQIVANSNFDGRLASFWLDGDFALSLVPTGMDASEFFGRGAVLLIGSFGALGEEPTFEMDGIALYSSRD